MEGLSPHKMFSPVISDYAWDQIYSKKLLPFLDNVVEEARKSIC